MIAPSVDDAVSNCIQTRSKQLGHTLENIIDGTGNIFASILCSKIPSEHLNDDAPRSAICSTGKCRLAIEVCVETVGFKLEKPTLYQLPD